MNNILYLFTLEGCSHCVEVKDRLKTENIKYKELDIDKHENIWDEVVKETEQDYVPTIFIQDDDDGSGKIYTPINDYNDIDELMTIIIENMKGD